MRWALFLGRDINTSITIFDIQMSTLIDIMWKRDGGLISLVEALQEHHGPGHRMRYRYKLYLYRCTCAFYFISSGIGTLDRCTMYIAMIQFSLRRNIFIHCL